MSGIDAFMQRLADRKALHDKIDAVPEGATLLVLTLLPADDERNHFWEYLGDATLSEVYFTLGQFMRMLEGPI